MTSLRSIVLYSLLGTSLAFPPLDVQKRSDSIQPVSTGGISSDITRSLPTTVPTSNTDPSSAIPHSKGTPTSTAKHMSKTGTLSALGHSVNASDYKLREVIEYLDSKHALNWTETKSGKGRITFISIETTDQAAGEIKAQGGNKALPNHQKAQQHSDGEHKNETTHRFESRKAPKMTQWANAGTVGGFPAQYQCYQEGDYGITSTAVNFVTQACDDLMQQSAQGQILNQVWSVWQSAVVQDEAGNPSIDVMGLLRWGRNPPKENQNLCQTAINTLAQSFCPAKGDGETSSQGGVIELGAPGKSDDGSLQFMWDPNDASKGT